MKRYGLMVLLLSSVTSFASAETEKSPVKPTAAVIKSAEDSAPLDKNSPEYIRRRLAELEKTLYAKTRREVIEEKMASVPASEQIAKKSAYVEKDELAASKIFTFDSFDVEKEVQKRLATEMLMKNLP